MVLSVEQIAERLDDCFGLLTDGGRTAMPRHQALHATMDWSHELLGREERILFRRLSVFAGGFTLETAESVCTGEGLERDEVLESLSHLVDKSLVVAREEDGEARYRLLETVRQYARGKLDGSGDEAEVGRANPAPFRHRRPGGLRRGGPLPHTQAAPEIVRTFAAGGSSWLVPPAGLLREPR
jgi:predicted ATPase